MVSTLQTIFYCDIKECTSIHVSSSHCHPSLIFVNKVVRKVESCKVHQPCLQIIGQRKSGWKRQTHTLRPLITIVKSFI
jgi:hypothetical protein